MIFVCIDYYENLPEVTFSQTGSHMVQTMYNNALFHRSTVDVHAPSQRLIIRVISTIFMLKRSLGIFSIHKHLLHSAFMT